MTFTTKNQLTNKRQGANDASHKQQMNLFFVKYEYDNFTHVSKDEFM